jgi:hypothetical protein
VPLASPVPQGRRVKAGRPKAAWCIAQTEVSQVSRVNLDSQARRVGMVR